MGVLQAYAYKRVTKGTILIPERRSVANSDHASALEAIESELAEGEPSAADSVAPGVSPGLSSLYPQERYIAAVRGEISTKTYVREVLRDAGVRFDWRGRRI